MKSRRLQAVRRILTGLVLVAIAAALSAGCGKKGPPRLPDTAAPDGVTDLAAIQESGTIVLSWTGFAAAGYHVYRSAESESEDACEGCPVLFQRVAKVPLAGTGKTPERLAYREPSVPGTRYRFKVVPYDDQGQLGPDSNIARLNTE